ncbi:PREDICTED: tripartite motif-containing protein 64-like [Hipposideros armiger]|uniref:Tripartite motif-containing protein 64-like n=1 Tax=Hipposideros armiger TaxID=186990 RepID=A0A8B7Q8C7_HIPAR|nr:PREDICTED: tripartite motif-containing protein 64-like [Hipposideros armiger]
MDSDTLQFFQNELICSICMNYFLDPITIDCGHSFCRPCLCLCWEEAQTPMCCPECRGVSEKPDFKTNIVLKNLASLARRARAPHVNSSEEQICVAHKEAKRLFCKVENSLLCELCSQSPEHVTHSHSPIQWAAEECRENLVMKMGSLWNMSQGMQKSLMQETNKTQSLKDYVALRKVMIKAEYQKMHLFLYEDEHLHLDTMEREAKEIFQQLKESEFRMIQRKESLKEMYRELIEMCHKPDAELLQDLGNVLERTELVQMQKPQPLNPELTSWCFPGILDMLNNFRVHDILYQETTSHCINLPEDVRSVMFGDKHQSTSREAQQVQSFAAWGAQAFTSGRHYWEVDVPHSSNWILGVCKDSLISDTGITIDFEEASLLFSSKMNNHYRLSTNPPPLIQYVKKPLGKVGIFLEYDSGTVSFYDAGKGSLICSLVSSSFSCPLKPFLCFGSP